MSMGLKRVGSRIINQILLAVALTLLPAAFALAASNNFSAGMKKYESGDFRSAEQAFGAAVKTEKAPEANANAFKYLGIVQYMQGKNNPATASFKKALQLNPSTYIDKNEVLDESILSFFGQIKTQNRSAAQPAAAPAQPAGEDGVLRSKFGKPTKTTYLRINSNVKTATVMIDGILSGSIGQLMESEPGTILIQLDAPGYITKRVRTKVTKNQENILAINLDKKKPKPKPAPPPPPQPKIIKPAPQELAQGPSGKNPGKKNAALVGKNRKLKGKGKLPDPGANEMFGEEEAGVDFTGGRDLTKEFAAETMQAPKKSRKKKQPPNVLAQQQQFPQQQGVNSPAGMNGPQGKDQLALNQGAGQPSYPQQPYAAPQPYVSPEQGGYPQQPYNYPQQPVQNQPQVPSQEQQAYGQPYTAPPPPPPPSENMGQQPQQAYQQPYGQPQAYPQQQYPAPQQGYQQQPGYQPAPKTNNAPKNNQRRAVNNGKKIAYNQPQNRGGKPRMQSTKTSSGGGSIFISLLPFGAGQFQNGSYILGSAFAGTEVLSLYFWYKSKAEADAEVKRANEINEDDDYDADEKKAYLDKSNEYVTTRRRYQYWSLGAFGMLWIGGAVESIINEPSPRSVRRVADADFKQVIAENLAAEDTPDDINEFKRYRPDFKPQIDLGLMLNDDAQDQLDALKQPAIALRIGLDF